MKNGAFLLLLVLPFLALSFSAHAEADLEIDDHFFHSAKSPYEDDELDRASRRDPVVVGTKQEVKDVSAVKNEFSSVQPGLMKSSEAAAMDRAVVAENKRRQKAILATVAKNTPVVKACVDKSQQKIQASQITLAWLIAPSGEVLQVAVKDTDLNNPEVEKCIYEASAKLKFKEAASEHLKQSLAEYTYKFNLKTRAPASARSKKARGFQAKK